MSNKNVGTDDSSDEDTYTPSGGARAKSAKNTSQGKGASETARNFKDSPSAPARNFRAGGPAAPSTSKKGGTLDKRKNEPSALREELKKGKAARRESASNLKGQGAKRKAIAAGWRNLIILQRTIFVYNSANTSL